MSPLKHSKSFAARIGRWSAGHWKTAVFGWLAFVVACFAIGAGAPMKMIEKKDAGVGESGKANKIVDDGFDLDKNGQSEFVVIQSKTKTVDDPAFQATISDSIRALSGFKKVEKLHSPLAAGNEGQISPDRHSVMITFSPRGTYDEAALYIDDIVAATAGVQKAHPDFYVAEAGVSSNKALDKVINGGIAKAGLSALVLTLIILVLVLGSAVSALVPVLVGLTAVFAAMGLVSLPGQVVPMDSSVSELMLLIGLAVGVDYSLFYLRRVRDERRAGRSERAAIEAAAATSGRAVLISGFTVIIAMAGMLLTGDKTFISFAIGTMTVVVVAMIGSLTVLPAVLSRLGDRVEKGRIPFLHRLRRENGEGGRFWDAILRPVLRHPLISAVASAAVLVALALPAFHLHTADSGLDALPKSQPELKAFHVIDDAFPGGAEGAVVAISGGDSTRIRAAIADLKAKALASGEMQNPIQVETSPDGSTFQVSVPLAGSGTDETSNHALTTLRTKIVPATVGAVPGDDNVYGLAVNPAAKIRRQPQTRSGDFAVLSPAEVAALSRAAESVQDAVLFTVAAFTGLRLGELRALRWRDVDFAGRIVHVRQNFVAGEFTSPKGKRVRSVPVIDQAAVALDGLSRRERFVGDDDLVFTNPVGEPFDASGLRRRFGVALSAPGLQHIRFHDLRHSFGTLAVQVFALSDVQAYMGHADVKTTMIYVHHVPKLDAAERLSALVKTETALEIQAFSA